MSRLKLLGQNIKKYRERKGYSQNELSDIVDYSREHLADIERGHKRISLKKLFLIADALEVKVSDIMDFD